MNQYNIPTDDVVFEPMAPSDIPSIIADATEPFVYEEGEPCRAVEEMIRAMAPQRKVLMGIMDFCRTAASVDDVKAEVARMQQWAPSVYTAADLSALLVEAGALEVVDANGDPYNQSAVEPAIIEEGGFRYYRANEPADMFWKTTEAGSAYLDQDDPIARVQAAFDADLDLLPIYKRALTLCDGDGAALSDLEAAIDHDPLVQSPRVYAPFFVDRLERADAIEWEGVWKLTDVGAEALGMLADVQG